MNAKKYHEISFANICHKLKFFLMKVGLQYMFD